MADLILHERKHVIHLRACLKTCVPISLDSWHLRMQNLCGLTFNNTISPRRRQLFLLKKGFGLLLLCSHSRCLMRSMDTTMVLSIWDMVFNPLPQTSNCRTSLFDT